MVKIIIFDRNERYVGSLKELLSAKQTMELNGEDFIDIETMDDRVEKGFRLLYHDRDTDKFFEYIVQSKDEYKQGNDIVSIIYADNSLSETMWDFIEDRRTINQPAKHAIDRALESTRWYSGEVDDMGLGTATFFRTNARAAISKIVEEWLFEIETEILWDYERKVIYRMIHFREIRGKERGVRITYTRDILEIKRRTLSRDVITALYGFGKGVESSSGGIGRRLSFSEINGGKGYIENSSARERWGRMRFDGERMHTFGKVEFDNITEPEKLLSRTKIELESLSKPAVSYETKILDYFRLSKSEHDYIELGDEVKILDRDFTPEVNYNTRILKIERNLLEKEDTTVTLGELVKTLADRDSEQDKEIEEEKEELPDWEDDDDDDWGPGGLPEYERAEDMVKVYPRLKIGLSSWIDVNEPDSLLMSSGRVGAVKDAITKDIVYSQPTIVLSPKTKVVDGRRFLSFNPDPMVLNRWEGLESDRPEDSTMQRGEFLKHENKHHNIKSIFIICIDRTPEKLGESHASGGRGAKDFFRAGTSCPIGHPFSHLTKVKNRPGVNIVVQIEDSVSTEDLLEGFNSPPYSKNRAFASFRRSNYWRNEVRGFPLRARIGESINIDNLGMNKKNYNDYLASNITGRYHLDTSHKEGIFYEMNAFFTGEIAELILFTRELDSEELELLTEYAKDKYGL